MIAVAFAAGTLVTALSVYSSVVERVREYGVVKAIGASGWRMLHTVMSQTLMVTVLAGAASYGIYRAAAWAVVTARPQFAVQLEPSALAAVLAAQASVRNMHMAASSVPLDAVETLRAEPGVARADPILYESTTLAAGGQRELAYLIGYQPGGMGGPETLSAGREPGPGEIVLDQRAAADLGIEVGDEVAALSRRWQVAGFVTDMGNIVNTLAYVRLDEFAAARQAPGIASFILVAGVLPPDELAQRVEDATGLTALSREAFSAEERRVVEDMSVEIMQIMTVAALIIGLAVVGLTLYAATLARLREIGVMKALGAGPLRLGGDVASQAGWTVGLAMAAALPLAVASGWVIVAITGNVAIAVEVPSVLRAAAGAAIVGAIGAVAPLTKVLRVDPASVFRRAS